MPDRPHLSSDPSSLLHSVQSFGELSHFLREGVADEESRELRDSIGALATRIDEVVTGRREIIPLQDLLGRIRTLMDHVRSHQQIITGLGSAWSPIYEYNAYVRAVQQLYDALVQWVHALQRRSPHEKSRFEAFDLVAWRTLGEGALLLDIYNQGLGDDDDDNDAQSAVSAPPASVALSYPIGDRLLRWWRLLRR